MHKDYEYILHALNTLYISEDSKGDIILVDIDSAYIHHALNRLSISEDSKGDHPDT